MQITDPEAHALLLVQQFLEEHNHVKALRALEGESRVLYDPMKLPEGGGLMQLVWQDMESRAEAPAAVHEDEEAHWAEVSDVANSRAGEDPHTFTSNIIHFSPAPDGALLVCTGDGRVTLLKQNREVEWTVSVGGGAALSCSACPEDSSGVCAATTMDGTVSLIDLGSGVVLHSAKPHTKYVVKCSWLPDGCRSFLTASWDGTVALHTREAGRFETMDTASFSGAVQDIELANGLILVAVRDSHQLAALAAGGSLTRQPGINMNARGDSHMSFWAQHLAVSPCGGYLLVSTEASRLIMLRVGSWEHVRNFYELPREQFHQAYACWHPDGRYIYACAAGGLILAYHVGSGKVVARLTGHDKSVRCVAYDPLQRVLVSGGYSKALKLHAHTQVGHGV